jgi:hypothetical protein
MRKVLLVTLSVLLTLAITLKGARGAEDLDTPPGKATRTFEFKYSAAVKNFPEGAKFVELWIPVPQDTNHQKIANLKFEAVEQPLLGVDPVQNNRIAYWKIDASKAKGFTVLMSFECTRMEAEAGDLTKTRELSAEEKTKFAPYLKADKLVLVGGDFTATAASATQGAKTPAEIAKAAYDYTLATMKYDKPADKQGWGKGSTQWACEAKIGNCTDFHALIMSIGRTRGVPVKFEMGFPIPPIPANMGKEGPPAMGVIGGYHCWAALYLGGAGWVPVDASESSKNPAQKEYFYGHLDENRVQVSSGRDVNLVPKQAGEALNFFVHPYAEVDGKPFAAEKTYGYTCKLEK